MNEIRSLYARRAAMVVAFTFIATLGLVSGALFAYSPDLPIIAELDDYSPGTITRIHARDGQVIGEYATERRVILTYDEIPAVLRNAIIAAEDGDFFSHVGFNIPRIVMTLVSNILQGDLTAAGASTITMQLARNVTLGGESLGLEKTWQRKLVEAFYTVQIEKRYTKREILTLYANQIWLGTARHSAFGVEAASRLYFDKSASELDLNEAATIVGTFPTPARWSPLVNMDLAVNRRNLTLRRMLAEGFITRAEADDVMARPVVLAERQERSNSTAPYFIEEVRQHLEREYGVARLYEQGLTVHTTLDVRLQEAANRAVEAGLRAHDKRRGFREPERNLLAEAAANGDYRDPAAILADYRHYRWRLPIRAGDIVPAVVTGVDRGALQVRFGAYTARVAPRGLHRTEDGAYKGFRGLGRKRADEVAAAGDLIEVEVTAIDDAGERPAAEAELEQEPLAEAALLAVENRTGRILAMVGGYDFDRSKFNRATQAYRQLGSLFKGVLYAAAIDTGYTATSILQDEPISYDAGPGQPPYSPTNYDHTYEGPVTLRRAMEKSRNVPAVWIMNEIGPPVVLDFARRLGFTSETPPYLSVALGSAEATLLEVTSAYSVFPNRGVRMVPYRIDRIVDRAGETLEENLPVPQGDAVPADTAYIMTSLMEGVVQRGTGIQASRLGWPLGGKTGTMDDYTDAWFVGFDPDVTVGVWVGYDEKVTLGYDEQGARVALPIWIDFMRTHIDGREAAPGNGFAPPANIVFASVDPDTGELAPWNDDAIQEAFIAGTAPGTELAP